MAHEFFMIQQSSPKLKPFTFCLQVRAGWLDRWPGLGSAGLGWTCLRICLLLAGCLVGVSWPHSCMSLVVGCLPAQGDQGDRCSHHSSSRRLAWVFQIAARVPRGLIRGTGLGSGLTHGDFATFSYLRQVTKPPSARGGRINLLRGSAKSHCQRCGYKLRNTCIHILWTKYHKWWWESNSKKIRYFSYFLIKDEKYLDYHWFFPFSTYSPTPRSCQVKIHQKLSLLIFHTTSKNLNKLNCCRIWENMLYILWKKLIFKGNLWMIPKSILSGHYFQRSESHLLTLCLHHCCWS